jgi:hypothetical protein
MGVEQTLKNANLGIKECKTSTVQQVMSTDMVRLERTEDLVQIILAAVVPSILAMMLFSYFLLPELLPAFFVAAVAVSALTLIPAVRMHRLHFRTWSKDSLVPKLMTSVVGMIYISVISIFAVSMLSLYEGLDPQQPTTFAAVGGMLMMLLVVMGYNSQTKQRFLSTEKRFFPHPVEAIEERIAMRLERQGHKHKRNNGPTGTEFEIEGTDLRVHVRRLRKTHSEVLVRNINDSNRHLLPKLKACVEGV